QRAVVGVGLVRSGGLGLLGLLGEGGGQVVVDAGGGEHAGGGGAVLSGVEVPGRGDVLGGLLHVGVVADDDGGLAAQLQVEPLEVDGGGLGDLGSGAGGAGERDEPWDRVVHGGAAGVAVAGDHVEHAGRQELRGDLGEQQGGHGRGVGRLEHDGVARGQRRADLPRG